MASTSEVLITRSGAAGQSLAERLQRHVPVIHYAPVHLEAMPAAALTRNRLLDCLPVDLLIAPSAEALRRLAELVPLAQLAAPTVVVPGAGTARVGRQLGFERIRYPAERGDSEHILALPELQHVAGTRVLIAAAAGGRGLIATELRQRGATVLELEVYRRIAVPPAREQIDRIRHAQSLSTLLASGGALLGLRNQLPRDCWETVASQALIAPSPRVAAMARQAGCVSVAMSGGADDEAMLRALVRVRPSLAAISYPVNGGVN